MLRYLDPEAHSVLACAASAELQFNYLGRYSSADESGDWRTPVGLSPLNGGRGDDMPVGYPLVLDVMAIDVDGRPELWFEALRGIVRAIRGAG